MIEVQKYFSSLNVILFTCLFFLKFHFYYFHLIFQITITYKIIFLDLLFFKMAPFPEIKSTHSLVAKHVTEELWNKLGDHKTETSGFTLGQVCKQIDRYIIRYIDTDQHTDIYIYTDRQIYRKIDNMITSRKWASDLRPDLNTVDSNFLRR